MEPFSSPSTEADSCRVFIVDDNAGYRAAVQAVVAASDGFELAGMAASASEARAALVPGGLVVDLVLMDIHLGEDDGIALTRELCRATTGIGVILMSTIEPADLPNGAEDCGALGYVPKSTLSPDALHRARDAVYIRTP